MGGKGIQVDRRSKSRAQAIHHCLTPSPQCYRTQGGLCCRSCRASISSGGCTVPSVGGAVPPSPARPHCLLCDIFSDFLLWPFSPWHFLGAFSLLLCTSSPSVFPLRFSLFVLIFPFLSSLLNDSTLIPFLSTFFSFLPLFSSHNSFVSLWHWSPLPFILLTLTLLYHRALPLSLSPEDSPEPGPDASLLQGF